MHSTELRYPLWATLFPLSYSILHHTELLCTLLNYAFPIEFTRLPAELRCTHGPNIYKDSKPWMSSFLKFTVKGTLRQVFNRFYRLEIHSLMLVFFIQLLNCCLSNPHLWLTHGRLNNIGINPWMSSLLVFNRVYRIEIQSVMLVFSTSLVNCCPFTFSLTSPTPTPFPK
jgi:uncharacterized membrane protein YhaH (DUF805 family)